MPVAQEEVVGFPRPWEPFHDATVVAEAVHRVNALQEIFSLLGVSVHAVVDSGSARFAVRALWKARKEMQRGYEAEAVRLWEEYLCWVEQQTGQTFADRTLPWVWRRRLVTAFV